MKLFFDTLSYTLYWNLFLLPIFIAAEIKTKRLTKTNIVKFLILPLLTLSLVFATLSMFEPLRITLINYINISLSVILLCVYYSIFGLNTKNYYVHTIATFYIIMFASVILIGDIGGYEDFISFKSGDDLVIKVMILMAHNSIGMVLIRNAVYFGLSFIFGYKNIDYKDINVELSTVLIFVLIGFMFTLAYLTQVPTPQLIDSTNELVFDINNNPVLDTQFTVAMDKLINIITFISGAILIPVVFDKITNKKDSISNKSLHTNSGTRGKRHFQKGYRK